MRIVMPERVGELRKMVMPYLNISFEGEKCGASLDENAPDNIKAAFEEYKSLVRHETENASEY